MGARQSRGVVEAPKRARAKRRAKLIIVRADVWVVTGEKKISIHRSAPERQKMCTHIYIHKWVWVPLWFILNIIYTINYFCQRRERGIYLQKLNTS